MANYTSFGVALACFAAATVLPAATAGATTINAAIATGLDLGNADGFAIVGLASGKDFSMNSGPVTGGTTGGVLVGNKTKFKQSGGNNGQVVNGVYTDGTAVISGALQVPATIHNVSTAYTAGVKASAESVSAFAAGLAADRTFGVVNTATTFTAASGGLTVINLTSITNADITFSGSANDFFVVNVTGAVKSNKKMLLSGGVTAGNILFNLLGTTGHVFETSGGNLSVGTFLATRGGEFQFSNLALTGSLINTAGKMAFVSGSKMSFDNFEVPPPPPPPPPPAVPLPSSAWLLFSGLFGVFFLRRRRNAA